MSALSENWTLPEKGLACTPWLKWWVITVKINFARSWLPADLHKLVLNSHNVPPPDYEMWRSLKIASGISVENMVQQIRKHALEAEKHFLNRLIFNSHGSPGKIKIGQGITENDLHHFQLLRKDEKSSLCSQIWIIACRVSGEDDVSTGQTGQSFCMELAKATLSEVTAAVKPQLSSGVNAVPPGHVDAWVGEVFTYYPSGVRKQRQ